MVTTFKKVDLEREREFEEALASDPSIVEGGLSVLLNRVRIEKGELDLLCIDKNNTLTLIDIELASSDTALLNALKYYDWVYENIEAVKQMLRDDRINTERTPRLIVFAPSFTEKVRRLVRHMRPVPELFEFSYLATNKGDKGIHIKKVETQVEEGREENSTPISVEARHEEPEPRRAEEEPANNENEEAQSQEETVRDDAAEHPQNRIQKEAKRADRKEEPDEHVAVKIKR